MKSQVSLLGIIDQKVDSLWNLAICVRAFAPGGSTFQAVSWNQSGWEGNLQWNYGKGGILPRGDFWRAGGKQKRGSGGLQSFAFDLLSVTSTETASYSYTLATKEPRCSVMAYHGMDSPKHGPSSCVVWLWALFSIFKLRTRALYFSSETPNLSSLQILQNLVLFMFNFF